MDITSVVVHVITKPNGWLTKTGGNKTEVKTEVIVFLNKKCRVRCFMACIDIKAVHELIKVLLYSVSRSSRTDRLCVFKHNLLQ